MRSPFLKFNAEMGIIYNIPPNTRDSKFFARENFFSNGAFFSLAAMLRQSMSLGNLFRKKIAALRSQ